MVYHKPHFRDSDFFLPGMEWRSYARLQISVHQTSSKKQIANDVGKKYAAFTKIIVDEIRAYLGSTILMSVVVLPSLGDYWSNHKDLHYKPVAGWLTRQRYQMISRYLHFVDNSTLASRTTIASARCDQYWKE